MRKIASAALLAGALALPAAAHDEGGTMAVIPTISVRGDGQALVAPDEATVRLGVLAQAETARAAQEQVNRAAGAILDAIARLGVERERIQTSELRLNPVYAQERPRPDGGFVEPRIVGYQAANVVSVRLSKLDLVGPVVDAGLGAGANQVEGVSFGLRDDAKARATALTAAVAEARAKAQTIAAALGVRLGEVVEVVEGGVAVYEPRPMFERMAMNADSSMAKTPVEAGQVGVDATVTVRYRIGQ